MAKRNSWIISKAETIEITYRVAPINKYISLLQENPTQWKKGLWQ